MDFFQIAFIVMTVVAIVGGARWRYFKVVVKEAAEAMGIVSVAIEDDSITRDECSSIAKEFADVLSAGKKLITG